MQYILYYELSLGEPQCLSLLCDGNIKIRVLYYIYNTYTSDRNPTIIL